MKNNKILLAITELGGYPDFTELYKKCGFQAEVISSMRKALKNIKENKPDVIVAEFNFQSDFRDRTSSLETLIAATQQMDSIKIIIFYENEYFHQFEKIRALFSFHAELAYPIDKNDLTSALESI